MMSSFDRFAAAKVENPMLRSGLALAGANTWLSGGPLPPEAGRGFLFAQDVAGLDLWANELTVLSACNTAMGDIKIGEGVFGLRRAFAVAGAKTLVMSLWPVPDKATALLMERFFDNLQRGLERRSSNRGGRVVGCFEWVDESSFSNNHCWAGSPEAEGNRCPVKGSTRLIRLANVTIRSSPYCNERATSIQLSLLSLDWAPSNSDTAVQ